MTIRVLRGTSSPITTSMKISLLVPALIGKVSVSPSSAVGPPTPAVRNATTPVVGGEVDNSNCISIDDSNALPTLVNVPSSRCVEPTIA